MHDTNSDTNNDGNSDTSIKSEKPPQLLQIELRVLGSLMEKQLTTPDAYPLTLNSLITACNQKSSREPVTSYHQGEISRTLRELEGRQLVSMESGSRSDKFQQRLITQLGLGRKQQALLCVMMLRGPQSLSELSSRTQRMCEFVDREELQLCVEKLCDRAMPLVIRLAPQPGQRGDRFEHLFSGVPVSAAKSNTEQTAPAPVREESGTLSQASQPDRHSTEIQAPNSDQAETVQLLEMEIAGLKEKMNAMQAETATLRQQLKAIIELNGLKSPV